MNSYDAQEPFLLTWLNFIPSVDKKLHLLIYCKVGDSIIYPFPNFNGCTIEVLELDK